MYIILYEIPIMYKLILFVQSLLHCTNAKYGRGAKKNRGKSSNHVQFRKMVAARNFSKVELSVARFVFVVGKQFFNLDTYLLSTLIL